MSLNHSPKIVTDGLVFYYDMTNTKKSWIGRPTTNTINALTTGIGRYNNPGFSGTSVNTGQTYNGFPIYKNTFIPQDSTYISRLASTEGFGAFHSMGIALQANTRYMASILFKSNYPLQNSVSQGFSNGYSNIGGWNQNGTTSARYQQDDGWTRLYTQYLNSTNGYSTRTSTFQTNFTVNTTTTQTVDLAFTVTTGGSGISDFAYLYAIVSASPSIASNGGLTALSIVDHGLDTTNFTKLSWPSTIELKTDLPLTYYVRVSVPSTGGINTTIALIANFGGYYTALTDSKYWKATFDTSNLAVGTEIETFWCCPMIEQHDTVYPSTFVNGTRSNTEAILDLVGGNTVTANSLTYNNDGSFGFNGSSNYLGFSIPSTYNNYTIDCWIKLNSTSGDQRWFSNSNNGTFTLRYSGTWQFHFNPLAGSPPSTVTSGTSVATVGVWYNVVVTNNQADSVSGAKCYVNGVLIGTAIPAVSLQSTGEKVGSREGTTSFGNGQCSLVKVYNRALSAQEIQQNFNATRGRYGV